MESSRAGRADMRNPDRWLAALRVGVGAWFIKGILTKVNFTLLWGFVPVLEANVRWTRVMPIIVNAFASEHPLEWYGGFLVDTVVANPDLFANLTALGETAVGVGLVLGIATRPFSVLGLFIMANYGLANFWTGFAQQGFHALLVLCMLAFTVAGAGRVWGADGWLKKRYPNRWFSSAPLG